MSKSTLCSSGCVNHRRLHEIAYLNVQDFIHSTKSLQNKQNKKKANNAFVSRFKSKHFFFFNSNYDKSDHYLFN